jgi:uncharacterized repeat protein (TIGR01451 family)
MLYANYGTIATGAVLNLYLPPEVTYLWSDNGGIYESPTHSVVWYVGTLDPGFAGGLVTCVSVPSTVPLGTMLTSTAQIDPIPGDYNPLDNISTESQEVRGSYDPNEKHVTPEGYIQITDMLTYKIDFQNVGTDTAFNIVIRDTLDENLDISTLSSGASSHTYQFGIAGRELIWTFSNINLPDSFVNEPASNGFVTFTIAPLSDITEGSTIVNQAAIYFDYNLPVLTNTVVNTIGPDAYSYLPGDANMSVGQWPPQVIGGDVTYLVNYFRGLSNACLLGGFYCSGDANADCQVIGSDVTRMVTYFRGLADIIPCPDYEPAWPTPDDLPVDAPSGWPNCE